MALMLSIEGDEATTDARRGPPPHALGSAWRSSWLSHRPRGSWRSCPIGRPAEAPTARRRLPLEQVLSLR